MKVIQAHDTDVMTICNTSKGLVSGAFSKYPVFPVRPRAGPINVHCRACLSNQCISDAENRMEKYWEHTSTGNMPSHVWA